MTKTTPSQSPPEPASQPWYERAARSLMRFERFTWDIAGILTLAIASMTLLAIIYPAQATGAWLRTWTDFLLSLFGWGSVWMVVAIGAAGLWMLRRRHFGGLPDISWGRIVALEVAAFTSLAALAVLGGVSFQRAEMGMDGGKIGWGLAKLLRMALQPLGPAGVILLDLMIAAFLVWCLVIGMGLDVPLRAWARRRRHPVSAIPEGNGLGAGVAISAEPLVEPELAPAAEPPKKKRPFIPPEFRKRFQVQSQKDEKPAVPLDRDDRLPPLELLVHERTTRPDERHINQTAGLIEKTLAEFGIPAKVVDFQVGPTVTQFAVVPGFMEKNDDNRQKVRVAQISSLRRDLALALSAERLRIQAPVPGRPYVGVEVPNSESALVRLRPILESEAFAQAGSPLAIALGRDVSGRPVVADLSRMPHLLIAGTTGSGKSVCIAALTTCLVANNTPKDLRLVMVDPKMVELVRFNGLPHLLGKVETDLERILGVLRWTVAEMDRRYKLLESTRSRNIDTYNRKAHRRKGEEPLPRIVLMIDELADLMMSAPDQTEHNLVRLAQMARATGIHLVVATQRPSTDVVTGLIKANFPARMSFAVASSIDSRVILDTHGAEALLGRGDMLFLPPEAAAPIRAQGVMVTDQEVTRMINFWQKATTAAGGDQAPPWEDLLAKEAMLADRDDLIEQAIEIVKQEQTASASMLQRRLRIGYPRAARLVDELAELGVVGPSQGPGRERDVMVGPDEEVDFTPPAE